MTCYSGRTAGPSREIRRSGPGHAAPRHTEVAPVRCALSEALTDMEVLAIPRSEQLLLCSRDSEIGDRIYSEIGRLFSNRYAETLIHLAVTAERELREASA